LALCHRPRRSVLGCRGRGQKGASRCVIGPPIRLGKSACLGGEENLLELVAWDTRPPDLRFIGVRYSS
jgi:hypothetical protein